MDVDKTQAFSCPTCGIDPKFFVGDGKCVGPLRKKLDGLDINELGCHPEDKKIHKQGSKFQDRQFLKEKKERDIVLELVTGSIDMDTFISNNQITSSNGKMLQDLVRHINSKWPLRLPKVYQTFITEICKTSSVVGLLQVNSSEPLKYLHQFSKKSLDIRENY